MKTFLKKALSTLILSAIILSTIPVETVLAATYQNGSRGWHVQYLQQNISFLGFSTGVADGIYGNNTKKAVMKLQKALGFSETGIVDESLNQLITGTIADIQTYLVKKGYLKGAIDGIKGNATEKAFKQLQNACGYAQTGIIDLSIIKYMLNDTSVNLEMSYLKEWTSRLTHEEVITDSPNIIVDNNIYPNIISIEELNSIKTQYENHKPYVGQGYSSNTTTIVKALQVLLNAEGGYYTLEENGTFGSDTYKAVCSFQARYGLTVDGIVGNATWNKLYEVLSSRIADSKNGYLDIKAMLDYAKLHWNNYNTANYWSYKNSNTDCCNYISQLLCAGGLTETAAWHGSKNYNDVTDEFDYIPNFINYMRSTHNIYYLTKSASLIAENPNEYDQKYFTIDDIEVGDCITYDVTSADGVKGRDHIMFVIGVNKSAGKIYYTAHTNDRFYGISGDGAGWISFSIVEGVLKTSDIHLTNTAN